MAGERDPRNHGAGTGFPNVDCDGRYSPLRADIHMPSCYNPEAGLDAWKVNSAFPTDAGSGRLDCPEGWIHLPHMFFEVYWDTAKFRDRWPSEGQPFVLSNGDATGYSLHADFIAAWDEDALQTAIDNCNVGHGGMHTCPGLSENTDDDCVGEYSFREMVTGVLDTLPGDLPLRGWKYGTGNSDGGDGGDGGDGADSGDNGDNGNDDAVDDGLPSLDDLPIQHAPEQDEERPAPIFSTVNGDAEVPEPTPAPEPEFEPEPEPEFEPEPEPTTSCKKNVKTVWETVTVTATATKVLPEPAATPADHKRRHVHYHALRHRSLRK